MYLAFMHSLDALKIEGAPERSTAHLVVEHANSEILPSPSNSPLQNMAKNHLRVLFQRYVGQETGKVSAGVGMQERTVGPEEAEKSFWRETGETARDCKLWDVGIERNADAVLSRGSVVGGA
jgi:hypothetical protein